MGKIDFIVTGLPRSRTAWLANYLTWGNTLCLHDGLARAIGTQRTFERLREDHGVPEGILGNFGVADAGALLQWERLHTEFPEAKWVVIQRPLKDVIQSVKRLTPLSENAERALAFHDHKLREVVRSINNLQLIEFDKVTTCAPEIMQFCGVDMPKERHEMLTRINVQAIPTLAFEEAEQLLAQGAKIEAEPARLSRANARYLELIAKMCERSPGAFEWFNSFLEAVLVWDHVIDDDYVCKDMTHRVFTALLTGWALNPFWQGSYAVLTPVVVNAISAWRFSNHPTAPKLKAYDVYTEVPATMAWLIGGQPLVDSIMHDIRCCAVEIMREDELRDGGKK